MNRRNGKKFYYLFFVFLIIGIVLVFDTSPFYAKRIGLEDPYRFLKLQVAWALVGLLAFVAFSFVRVDFLKNISKKLFFVSFLLLLFVALISVIYPCRKVLDSQKDISFCPCKNGARRWVNLNPPPLPQLPIIGTIGFQVVDFVKFAFVLYAPLFLESKFKLNNKKKEPFYGFLGLVVVISFLVMLQPNLSNAILIAVMGISIYLATGFSFKPVLKTAPLLVIAFFILIFLFPHARKRFMSMFAPNPNSFLGELYQSEQILIGIGAGGLLGVGFGQSLQKHNYTPELIGDSIFAIVGEELGFVGSVLFIFLFAYFVSAMINIVASSTTFYEKGVGMGVVSWVFFQYIINLYSTIRLIIPTGIPIPLVSYGGSSMLFSMAALGLISNIYLRYNK